MATLEQIRANVKAGKIKPAAPLTARPGTPAKGPTKAPPINPHQLDAIYARGTQSIVGSNSHYAGLRAVYEAGVAGARE